MNKILIIGACGQLGTELTIRLRKLRGKENVIASDLSDEPVDLIRDGKYQKLNILDQNRYHEILKENGITEVYHLAAVLSARGEQDPKFAWKLNMDSLLTVLDSGREGIKKIFWPSSIAVFGPDTPPKDTPQRTVMNPNTVYGISKQAGERWCEYYFQKFGVDVRSLRYPGLIGYKALPGGGTTDYAVDIFHKAIKGEMFDCFLREESRLPMMYMDDAVKATMDLMQAPADQINIRSSYNLSAMSFTPSEIVAEIRKHYPEFQVSYRPDFRQQIADGWPGSIDDSHARSDWGWQPEYDLSSLVKVMLSNLKESDFIK
ncbi:MAG: NAD-dependent epimerase/dehydratase family protein [Bacteroidota bacterium]